MLEFFKKRKVASALYKQAASTPKFKYISENGFVLERVKNPLKCECCRRYTYTIYTNGLYCKKEVDVLCPDCVQSGRAAKKFNGLFNDGRCAPTAASASSREELEKRTPALNTWKSFAWPFCCDDYCVFERFICLSDFDDNGAIGALLRNFSAQDGTPFEQADLRTLLQEEEANLLLFKCKQCNRLYLVVDVD